ncbi:hypothetical protein Tsubulata_033029 [Turnera subulata]|uniref:Flotillin-like n=1 Tax=Turnera subulata TaxID=218843 RepID=A0A9Q0FQJ6_9ROSI|nr:hypothetical protein Tsubulata_033029 [Turnera subulata]
MGFGWKVARESEYLAIYNKKSITFAKKALVCPLLHKCIRLDVSPVYYSSNVKAWSRDICRFTLPVVSTVGPWVDDMECLRLYASRRKSLSEEAIRDMVRLKIAYQIQRLASCRTMLELYLNGGTFKEKVLDNVQFELKSFGLKIYYLDLDLKLFVDPPHRPSLTHHLNGMKKTTLAPEKKVSRLEMADEFQTKQDAIYDRLNDKFEVLSEEEEDLYVLAEESLPLVED